MQLRFKISAYLQYWLNAVDEHSLHSPFLFEFYRHVFKPRPDPDPTIEALRKSYLHNQRILKLEDPGAGSKHGSDQRLVQHIARYSLSPVRFSSLYERLIRYRNMLTVIELGTSLGINTLYLSKPEGVRVYTFEGIPELVQIARQNFNSMNRTNINLIEGNLDTTLASFIDTIPSVDLVFMDANHRYEPTMRYFETLLPKCGNHTIILVDDIHDSPQMERAWDKLRLHHRVYTSVDAFRFGILFLDSSLSRQHWYWQF
ncbi:MAG: class I SAM-dependent methyltransferase [Cyclobacteriaceae bacterium]|nr:class I SAM-dependent methyltransferase [Cyclobacteriaceae bacterium]